MATIAIIQAKCNGNIEVWETPRAGIWAELQIVRSAWVALKTKPFFLARDKEKKLASFLLRNSGSGQDLPHLGMEPRSSLLGFSLLWWNFSCCSFHSLLEWVGWCCYMMRFFLLYGLKKKCLADYIDCSFLYFGLGRRGEHSARPPPPLALTENNLQLSS